METAGEMHIEAWKLRADPQYVEIIHKISGFEPDDKHIIWIWDQTLLARVVSPWFYK